MFLFAMGSLSSFSFSLARAAFVATFVLCVAVQMGATVLSPVALFVSFVSLVAFMVGVASDSVQFLKERVS